MTATDEKSPRPVLVVTEADDLTADMVITELNRREVPVVRFNPSDFGDALTMSARFGGTDEIAPTGCLETPSRVVALDRVRSTYWRRPTWPDFDHLDDPDARYAAAQVRHGLGGTLYALSDCLYVNHPLRNHAADFKPSQLTLAQRLGLPVAPTLVSNRIDDIRDFIKVHDQVIYKVLRWTSYRHDDVGWSTWTQPVGADEIDESVRIRAGSPDIDDVELTVTQEGHTYEFSSDPGLRWVHRIAR